MKHLLVNPPAYTHVKKMASDHPMALLKLSTYLKGLGDEVDFFDFMPLKHFSTDLTNLNEGDMFFKNSPSEDPNQLLKCYKGQKIPLNRNSFLRETGESISRLGFTFPRLYNGVDGEFFRDYLINNKPDKIWISSGIAYGYNGTIEAIRICKEVYPHVEVELGGLYPTLCYEHAVENSGADIVHRGRFEEIENLAMDYDIFPNKPTFIIRQFSRGCPNSCKFCSVSYIDGKKLETVNIDKDIAEIKYLSERFDVYNIKMWGSNVLLPGKGKVFEEWLDKLIGLGKRFMIKSPEGFAPELLTVNICKKMHRAGFMSLEIPIETGSDENIKEMDKKYDIGIWSRAIEYAFEGGFRRDQVCAPVILGSVGQKESDLDSLVNLFIKTGVRGICRPYSPVPKSEWYEGSEWFKNLDIEYLDGNLFPSVRDMTWLKKLQMFQYLLMDMEAVGMNNKRKRYLKEIGTNNKKPEEEMDQKILTSMANLLVDISEQNNEILEKIKGISEENQDLKNRIVALECK